MEALTSKEYSTIKEKKRSLTVRDIVGALLLSPHYFDLRPAERLNLIRNIARR